VVGDGRYDWLLMAMCLLVLLLIVIGAGAIGLVAAIGYWY
jgi:hypothetical protein